MPREPKRGGRNPKLPYQLIAESGGFVGEHATFTYEDIADFTKRHDLESRCDELFQAFVAASDRLRHANDRRENEPAHAQWRKAFNNLSNALGRALELAGIPPQEIQAGWRKYDTPMLERAAFAAHRGLFNVREQKITDREHREWELGASLLELGLDSNSVFKAIESAPNVLRTLQIAAELAALEPMAIKTTKNGPFVDEVITIYERVTGVQASLRLKFRKFLKDSAKILGHRIESDDAVKEMIRDALENRRNLPSGS